MEITTEEVFVLCMISLVPGYVPDSAPGVPMEDNQQMWALAKLLRKGLVKRIKPDEPFCINHQAR